MNANQSTTPSAVSVSVLDQEVSYERRNKSSVVSVHGGLLAGGKARDAGLFSLTDAAYQKALDGNYRSLVEFMRAAFSGATSKFCAKKKGQVEKELSDLWANKTAFRPYALTILDAASNELATAKQRQVLRLLKMLEDDGHLAVKPPVAAVAAAVVIPADQELLAA